MQRPSVHVTLSQIGFKIIFPLIFKPMFVYWHAVDCYRKLFLIFQSIKTDCIFIKALCILCKLCIAYVIPVNLLKDITLDR